MKQILFLFLILSASIFAQVESRSYVYNLKGSSDGDTTATAYDVSMTYKTIEVGFTSTDSSKFIVKFWVSADNSHWKVLPTIAGDTVVVAADAGGFQGYKLKDYAYNRLAGASYLRIAKTCLSGQSDDANGANITEILIRRKD